MSLYVSSLLLFYTVCPSGKINDFNLEEEAYDWPVSQYPERKKIQDKLTPFLRLYETATDFLNQHDQWLNGPLSGVNPDKVGALEHDDVMFHTKKKKNREVLWWNKLSFDLNYMNMNHLT